MAVTRYVDSNAAGGTGTGLDWTNAFLTLKAAVEDVATVGGSTIYVAQNHANSVTAAVTITAVASVTPAAPLFIICADKTSGTPPTVLATTAVEATTGNSTFTVKGSMYCYGVTFKAGDGANTVNLIMANTASNRCHFENCGFWTQGTTGGAVIFTTTGAPRVTLVNPSFKSASATTGHINSNGVSLRIRGGSYLSGGTNPSSIFSSTSGNGTPLDVDADGFDFSNLASTQKIVSGGSGTMAGRVILRNCKAPSGWDGTADLYQTALSVPGLRSELYNCDGTNTNYHVVVGDYNGQTNDDETYTRTGGASNGVTSYSWKMVSSSTALYPINILRSPEINWYNTVTGSAQTLTVEIIHSGVGAGTAGALRNDEIWLEVQGLTTTGFPLSTFTDDQVTKTNWLNATYADQPTSTAAWNASPSTPVKQKLSVTVTPAIVGRYIVTACLAKASKTVYVDPFITF